MLVCRNHAFEIAALAPTLQKLTNQLIRRKSSLRYIRDRLEIQQRGVCQDSFLVSQVGFLCDEVVLFELLVPGVIRFGPAANITASALGMEGSSSLIDLSASGERSGTLAGLTMLRHDEAGLTVAVLAVVRVDEGVVVAHAMVAVAGDEAQKLQLGTQRKGKLESVVVGVEDGHRFDELIAPADPLGQFGSQLPAFVDIDLQGHDLAAVWLYSGLAGAEQHPDGEGHRQPCDVLATDLIRLALHVHRGRLAVSLPIASAILLSAIGLQHPVAGRIARDVFPNVGQRRGDLRGRQICDARRYSALSLPERAAAFEAKGPLTQRQAADAHRRPARFGAGHRMRGFAATLSCVLILDPQSLEPIGTAPTTPPSRRAPFLPAPAVFGSLGPGQANCFCDHGKLALGRPPLGASALAGNRPSTRAGLIAPAVNSDPCRVNNRQKRRTQSLGAR